MTIAFNIAFIVFFLTAALVIACCLPSEIIRRRYSKDNTPPPWVDFPWFAATVSGVAAIVLAFLTQQPLYAAILTYAACITWMVACFRIERGWGNEISAYHREIWMHILAPFVVAIDIVEWVVKLAIHTYHAIPGLVARNTGKRAK